MSHLKQLWKETDDFVRAHETQIVEKYIHFLHEVAKHYLSKGARVFFRENRVVHYGEGGFGSLIVETEDDEQEMFGDYILEIRFTPKLEEADLIGAVEITAASLSDIKYEIN
jgi:hypothetical protein